MGSDPGEFVPAIPATHQGLAQSGPEGLAQSGPDHLRTQAELLIKTLSDDAAAVADAKTSLLELIVDGYAHVLALDVDRRRIEREINHLAQSGDPQAAVELRALSELLESVASTSEELRRRLDETRAEVERHF